VYAPEYGFRPPLRGNRTHRVTAFLMDIGLGLSLGMYYTVVSFSRVVVPLPGFVALGAPFLYYNMLHGLPNTVTQAWLWMACFPVVGLMWRGALWVTASLLRLPVRPNDIARATGRCAWPLLLPALAMMLALGWTKRYGFQWDAFVEVCLRRRSVSDPGWPTPVFVPLAILAMGLELRSIWRLVSYVPARRKWGLVAGAVFLTLIAIAAVGQTVHWLGVMPVKGNRP